MQKNVDALAYAYMAYAGWMVFWTWVAVAFMIVCGFALSHDPDVLFLWALTPPVLVIGSLMAVPFWVAGRGIQRRRPWARVTSFVLVFLSIGSFPVGFLLGVLTLLVMTDADVANEFLPATARA